MYFLGVALGSLAGGLSGRNADRNGSRPLVLLGFFLVTGSQLLLVAPTTLEQLAVAGFTFGIGFGIALGIEVVGFIVDRPSLSARLETDFPEFTPDRHSDLGGDPGPEYVRLAITNTGRRPITPPSQNSGPRTRPGSRGFADKPSPRQAPR